MKPASSILAAILLLLAPGLTLYGTEALPNFRKPGFITEGYERSIHARDGVYRYISAVDQRRVRIPIRVSLPSTAEVSVVLSKNEVVVQPGELFEISLRVKNHSKQRVNARIDHAIEPRQVANFLDLVECGFLVPVTLHPEIETQYFATYLLRESIPADIHQLSLTYDFKLRPVLGSKY